MAGLACTLVGMRLSSTARSPFDVARMLDAAPPDEIVLERVKAGETELFEVIMRRNNQRIYRAVRAIVRDDVEAEDVMQETYVRAFAHLAEFRGAARLSTWLTRIAVHEALSRLRKLRRLGELDDETGMNGPTDERAPSPEAATADAELGDALERAIDTLPEGFRTVFMLRAVEGLSVAETAEILAIPEDTVKTRLFRARDQLQTVLAGTDHAPDKAFRFLVPRCNRVVDAVFRTLARARAS
jgi:RNA polymerase sigma-70 factor, ECF subfamily